MNSMNSKHFSGLTESRMFESQDSLIIRTETVEGLYDQKGPKRITTFI